MLIKKKFSKFFIVISHSFHY